MSLKYCIKERLLKLSVLEYKRVRKELPKALGKTIRTFDRYCNYTTEEHGDIPALDLDIIASFLNCSADDLKNYTVNEKEVQQRLIRRK